MLRGVAYVQKSQPKGVPPLELTGERTLPDVPEENYWYRRHVAVYKWIAERCAGLRVVDLASGEGYGSVLLAERAAEVIGVPGRDAVVVRGGLVALVRINAELDVLAQLLPVIASPDDIGLHGAEFNQLGVRWRWATGADP